MLLYYITDRRQFPGDERQQRARLLATIRGATVAGVDYIQLRERDLDAGEQEKLAREAVAVIHDVKDSPTRLLINSRTDVALAVGADGVHLRSDDIAPSEARAIWQKVACSLRPGLIAASCHSVTDVRYAEAHGADFAVFAPVFEKVTAPARAGVGLEALRAACVGVGAAPNVEGVAAGRMPVLALGGVTPENARECMHAGAAGIAAIRLFQEHNIQETVEALRRLRST